MRGLNLDQLRTFADVVALKSFSRRPRGSASASRR